MSQFELLSYAAVTAGAVLWYAVANRAAIASLLLPKPPTTGDDWMKGWVSTLLDLMDALEKEGMPEGVVLVRELLWRMMGGKAHDIMAKGEK